MTRLWRRFRAWLRPPVREGWGPVLRRDAVIDALVRRAFYRVPDEEDER